MTAEFRNTEIFYTARGHGNPLVLLHGFLESGTIWQDFMAGYENERQTVAIDLPGHGRSGCFGETHSMEDMAGAVQAVLKELQIERADFIGHSMGGYVAMAFTEKYPEKVKNLILLNSTPAADSKERRENRERAISVVEKNKKAFISMAISNLLTPENHLKFKKELEKMKADAMTFPTKGITAALKGMKNRIDRTEVLKSFRGKKSIMAGKKDPILDFKAIKKLASDTECHLYSFPDGHLTLIENKEEFKKTMLLIE